jgi:hypothetical protein
MTRTLADGRVVEQIRYGYFREFNAEGRILRDVVAIPYHTVQELDAEGGSELFGDPPAGMSSWGMLEGFRMFRRDGVPDSPTVRVCLAFHGNGEWGSYGRPEDVQLDDDHRWCPVMYSVAVQNAVSYERRQGLIRSLWPAAGIEIVSYEWRQDRRAYARQIIS